MSAYKNPDSLPFPQSIMSEIVQANFSRSDEFFKQQAMEEMKQALLNPPEKMSSIFIGGWNDIAIKGPPDFKHYRLRSLLVTLEDERGKLFVTTAKYNHQHKYWFNFSDSRFYKFKVIAWAKKPDPYKP